MNFKEPIEADFDHLPMIGYRYSNHQLVIYDRIFSIMLLIRDHLLIVDPHFKGKTIEQQYEICRKKIQEAKDVKLPEITTTVQVSIAQQYKGDRELNDEELAFESVVNTAFSHSLYTSKKFNSIVSAINEIRSTLLQDPNFRGKTTLQQYEACRVQVEKTLFLKLAGISKVSRLINGLIIK